jgi:hypothetical protein
VDRRLPHPGGCSTGDQPCHSGSHPGGNGPGQRIRPRGTPIRRQGHLRRPAPCFPRRREETLRTQAGQRSRPQGDRPSSRISWSSASPPLDPRRRAGCEAPRVVMSVSGHDCALELRARGSPSKLQDSSDSHDHDDQGARGGRDEYHNRRWCRSMEPQEVDRGTLCVLSDEDDQQNEDDGSDDHRSPTRADAGRGDFGCLRTGTRVHFLRQGRPVRFRVFGAFTGGRARSVHSWLCGIYHRQEGCRPAPSPRLRARPSMWMQAKTTGAIDTRRSPNPAP